MKKKLNSEPVQLYLPPNLARRVRAEAARLEVSLTEFIRSVLRDSLRHAPDVGRADPPDAEPAR